jgi:hypothetical protein
MIFMRKTHQNEKEKHGAHDGGDSGGMGKDRRQ